MVYRNTKIQALCAICATGTSTTCRHCEAPHCPDHLVSSACPGCQSQLWTIERNTVQAIGGLYGLLTIPAYLLAVMLAFSGFTAWLGFSALFLLPLGYLSLPLLVRPIVRRMLAGKSLAPTSRRLPSASPEPVATRQPSAENEAYRARARNNRSRARRGPKRLKAFGRGFYYN